MYCPNCGVPAPPDARFCQACGQPIGDQPPRPIPVRQADGGWKANEKHNLLVGVAILVMVIAVIWILSQALGS
jgi:hypothetical protein